ncbi:MAG: hypothetical protein V2I47_04760 [Bacteroidales bacterium]|jgi:hypothetical protein|nr:hypothetical protein [Bacteroidales bacterium]
MAKKQHTANEHDDFTLKPDLSITYRGKASLKRSEETGIPLVDEAAIANMEGDVPGREVDAELAARYASTRLRPDLNIRYPDPASLKRRPGLIPVYTRYAAAAIILLLISIGSWFIFNPASIPETGRYDLTFLGKTDARLDAVTQSAACLEIRAVGDIVTSSSSREAIQLERMDANTGVEIESSDLLANNIPILLSRPVLFPQPAISSLQLAAGNQEPKKKGLLGRMFSGFFNKVSAPFDRDGKSATGTTNDGFLWNVAQLGVKSINVLGDHDYTLVRDYNEKGNVKGVIVLDE